MSKSGRSDRLPPWNWPPVSSGRLQWPAAGRPTPPDAASGPFSWSTAPRHIRAGIGMLVGAAVAGIGALLPWAKYGIVGYNFSYGGGGDATLAILGALALGYAGWISLKGIGRQRRAAIAALAGAGMVLGATVLFTAIDQWGYMTYGEGLALTAIGGIVGLGSALYSLSKSKLLPDIPPPQEQLPEATAMSQAELRLAADRLLKSIAGRVDREIYERSARICNLAVLALEAPEPDPDAAIDRARYHLRQTVLAYLPDALGAYLTVPTAYTHSRLGGRKSAYDTLVEQLELLEASVMRDTFGVVADETDRLEAHGRFLDATLGRSSLDVQQLSAEPAATTAAEPAATPAPAPAAVDVQDRARVR